MKLTMLLLFATIATHFSHGQQNPNNEELVDALALTEFSQLNRLHAAIELMKFPKLDNRIRTWRQHKTIGFAAETDPGIGIAIDADEWTLQRVKDIWAINQDDYDLANVAVISNRGKQIQFIDMTEENVKKVRNLAIRRGDAVIFLKAEEAR